MLERFCGNLPDDPAVDPMPAIKGAFTNIAMAKVSVGADDARVNGFLRGVDQIMDLCFPGNTPHFFDGLYRASYVRGVAERD